MKNVLALQMIPLAGLETDCADSSVSCESGMSCLSGMSCMSNTSGLAE